ncbi:MAG: hypothetical protein KF760_04215 [Candidatus Eremiobacteraeota bacterium]|nr:hypothetical protein [Candidatus Eremiobacteraeota bacterium]MCW5867120.1 hypothetical protein [Candidatus Eremiobacteraeota bacterium]
MKKFLIFSALTACLAVPAGAQLWRKSKVEVKAGSSAGPVFLGQPLGKATLKYLGKVSQQEAAGAEVGSGTMLFGSGDSRDLRKGFLLRLNDGVKPENVYAIQVKGIRASTREGIYLDGPANMILKKYPDAQQDINPFSRNPEFCVPGLTIRTKAGKVEEFLVESKDSQRWRFRKLTAVPGVKVGPFEVGKPVPPEAFELLGPPAVDTKPTRAPNSGLLRWAVAGQRPDRMIEVILHNGTNPRAIVSVRVRGIRAQTDRKVKLGDPSDTVKDLYPDGRPGLSEGVGSASWRVPGANFVLKDDQLHEILIYDIPKSGRTR